MPNNIEKRSGNEPAKINKLEFSLDMLAILLGSSAGASLIVKCGGPAEVFGVLLMTVTGGYAFYKGVKLGYNSR